MDDQGENFDRLCKLLALKNHEVPPPGYFHRFPDRVISRIRSEQHRVENSGLAKLDAEAPWLIRFWQTLQGKPVFAGAFGAAICSLVLVGIYSANKPATTPDFAGQGRGTAPFVAMSPDGSVATVDKPLLMTVTNAPDETIPQNLFDLVQPLQMAPASAHPGN